MDGKQMDFQIKIMLHQVKPLVHQGFGKTALTGMNVVQYFFSENLAVCKAQLQNTDK